jgi:hypothetical protein
MARTDAHTKQRNKKIRKILQGAWPFLVAAGLVNESKQRQGGHEITVVLGHKTVLLPSKKIATTRYLRRGQRYLMLKDGEPIASVDLAPSAKGKPIRYHVTYGPIIGPLYKSLLWLTTERRVPEMKITVLEAMHLGKNFLYDERMKKRTIYEVADTTPPMQTSAKELIRMSNKMIGFLQREHKKFKTALRKKLRKVDVGIRAIRRHKTQ